MATGVIKWFNKEKGYGFIKPNGGGDDVFLHASALERAGIKSVTDGQEVSFDIEDGKNGKKSASNLVVSGAR